MSSHPTFDCRAVSFTPGVRASRCSDFGHSAVGLESWGGIKGKAVLGNGSSGLELPTLEPVL